jgi:hypothetical protein
LAEALNENPAQRDAIQAVARSVDQLHDSPIFASAPLHRNRRSVDPAAGPTARCDSTERRMPCFVFSGMNYVHGVSKPEPVDYFRLQAGFSSKRGEAIIDHNRFDERHTFGSLTLEICLIWLSRIGSRTRLR